MLILKIDKVTLNTTSLKNTDISKLKSDYTHIHEVIAIYDNESISNILLNNKNDKITRFQMSLNSR